MTNLRKQFNQNPNSPHGRSSILVVTPFLELGEIICESLKDLADMEHVSTSAKAISFLGKNEICKQVILDMELGELSILNLGRALRQINPAIEILIISKEEPPTDLDEIQPWKFLRKPLLLREIQAALGFETSQEDGTSEIIDLDPLVYESRTPLNWSTNPALATRYLARLIEKSFAQEALLIQDQALWSYAGRLPEESVREVGRMVTKASAGSNVTDFMRFVKLETTQSEHALYASLIAVGIILALVFDPDIPLNIVRKQTLKMADTLLLLDGDDGQKKALSIFNLQENGRLSDKIIAPMQYNNSISYLENENLKIEPVSYSESKTSNPSLMDQPSHEIVEGTPSVDLPEDLKNPNPIEEPDRSALDFNTADSGTTVNPPQPVNENTPNMLEMMSDSLYNLHYSCMLIPRFPSHLLTKNKIDVIAEYFKKISISYGWRLEDVEVRSDSLRWTFSLSPSIALTKYLSIIRKETSKRIFDDFPAFKKENPSGDYWAPGFLILGGKKAISDQLAMDYTKQNRQKHGVKQYL
jgi:REP element-mobilizing transposase RayT/CheY-like chemotaxis protein